jgi:tetratricopeptide (TPR) repeat protein
LIALGNDLHDTHPEESENAYSAALRLASRAQISLGEGWFYVAQLQQYQLWDYEAARVSYNEAIGQHVSGAVMGLASLITDHYHDHASAIKYFSVALQFPEHALEARLSIALLLDLKCCRYIEAGRIYAMFVVSREDCCCWSCSH